jgi:Family of unknown function (DUF5670)
MPEGAREEMKKYCAAHPKSPTATQRPQLSLRNGLWIALLGPSVEDGIVGIGSTVEDALRAFDTRCALDRVHWLSHRAIVRANESLTQPKGIPMLWTIIVILVVLWLLGFIGHVGGSLIHILLVIAVIVLIINLVQGRRGL